MRTRTLGFTALAVLALGVLFWLVGGLTFGHLRDGATWGQGAWGMGPGMMPWGGGTALGWSALFLMMGSRLLFWVAIILGFVVLVRWIAEQNGRSRTDTVDAMELARQRYARGDISREEYERLREDLSR